MLTRHVNKLLSVTAVMLVAACTDNNILNPLSDVAGRYQLTIFAGATVPIQFAVQPGEDPDLPNGGTWNVTGGTLDLRENGTFTETNFITKTPTSGSAFNANFVSVGTYSVGGSTIQFDAPQQNGLAPRSFDGVVSQDRINYTEYDPGTGQQFSYEYRR
jgi:hypothetical protein